MNPLAAVAAVGAIQVIGAQRRAADLPAAAPDPAASTDPTATELSGTGLLLQALDQLPVTPATLGQAVGIAALPLSANLPSARTLDHPALQPLLPAPPLPASADTAALASHLQQALSGSGLFYEAHLLEWISGTRDTASVRTEPQARLPVLAPAAARDGHHPATPAGATLPDVGAAPTVASRVDAHIVHPLAAPLVHQQLQALDQQTVHWNVQAWPGQLVQLSAQPVAEPLPPNPPADTPHDGSPDPDGQHAATAQAAPPPTWKSTLRLHLPHLGVVQAEIRLCGSGCQVHLLADAASTGRLRQHLPALGSALDQAGLHTEALRVQDTAGSAGRAGHDGKVGKAATGQMVDRSR